LVKQGVNGFACTDEESFYQATLELCTNDELRESATRASREHSLLFEKRTIVKQMLENYSQVTDEFYCEYGGHHENRDAKYLLEDDAFIAGTHPRPCALACVEFVFITAFRVMTWLWAGFVWFHTLVISRMLMTRTVGVAPPRAAVVAKKKPIKTPVMKRTDSVTLTIMEEGEEHDDGDETSATASIGETASFTSSASTESEASNSSSDAASSCVSTFDGSCVTGLSATIIRMIAFQCRFESGVRNRIKSCGRTRLTDVVPKRKNSSMSRPPLTRDRSSGSDCSDESRETLKRRLRRSPTSNGSVLEGGSP